MFDLPLSLRAPGTPWGIVWIYSHIPKKAAIKGVSREEVLKFDFKTLCERFEESLPTPGRREKELQEKFSLFLTGKLLFGVVRLFDHRASLVVEIAERASERVTAAEELSQEISETQLRPLSPIDYDFDYNEEARANVLGEDMVGDSRFDQLVDNAEQPIGPQAEEDVQMEEPAPRANRRTRKRTRKAVVESDIEDEEVVEKRRTRRRRNVPAPNLARREDITMREDHVGEVERDLEELEPLNEQILSTADGHPVQLNDDTLLIINPLARRQPSPVPFDDYGFDAVNPDPVQEVITHDRQPSIEPYVADERIGAAIQEVQARLQSSTHQDVTAGLLEQVRAALTPEPRISFLPDEQISTAIPLSPPPAVERLPSGIQSIICSTPEQVRNFTRGSVRGSFYPDDQISAILQSPSVQARLRSASPSRIIAVTMMSTPPRSAAPSVHGTPVRGVICARSSPAPALPPTAASFDDFNFVPAPEMSKSTFVKRSRIISAREPPIKLSNDKLINRDQLYLRKNHREKRRLRALAHVAEVKTYYQKIFQESFVLEVNDDLRAMIDSRVNGSVDENARRRETRSPGPVEGLRQSQISALRSPRGTSFQPENQPPTGGDAAFNDFDNDYRPATPVQESALQAPVQQLGTPTHERSRSPMDIDTYYDGIVPLPKVSENLLSPPRAFPPDLFKSDRPFKEIGCKYDHDHLYKLLLYRCVKEKKVVFTFEEFASQWPRAFVAKLFHNLLLLIQMRRIVAHSRDNRLQSFIMIPNKEFQKKVAEVATNMKNVDVF